jgi:preprotein translocase subunit YajC
MTSSKDSKSSNATPPLAPGDSVITPSGSRADVVNVYADGEALVQWTSGDRARFKVGLLKRVPDIET